MSAIRAWMAAAAALAAIAPACALAQDKPLTPLRIATLKIAAQTDASARAFHREIARIDLRFKTVSSRAPSGAR